MNTHETVYKASFSSSDESILSFQRLKEPWFILNLDFEKINSKVKFCAFILFAESGKKNCDSTAVSLKK